VSVVTKSSRKPKKSPATSPLTVSASALVVDRSDRRFRAMLHDLLTIAARLEMVRDHLGGMIGITAPQYSVLMAIHNFQDANGDDGAKDGSADGGVSVGALAQALHVSSAFIAAETGKLARLGLVAKRTNPHDRRGVLLSVAPAGCARIDRIAPEIRRVNDLFFGGLDAASFAALCGAAQTLVGGSLKAVRRIAAARERPSAALRAVG
jgi:DNA-binding MarR family transcriptional regulator